MSKSKQSSQQSTQNYIMLESAMNSPTFIPKNIPIKLSRTIMDYTRNEQVLKTHPVKNKANTISQINTLKEMRKKSAELDKLLCEAIHKGREYRDLLQKINILNGKIINLENGVFKHGNDNEIRTTSLFQSIQNAKR